MRKQLERFLFDQANPRSAAILRIWLAAVTAAVFYPADGMAVNSAIRSPWTAPLYKDLFLTQAYWGLAFIALAAFAGGWRTRITGLAAALLLAPCVPVQDRLPGRFMMWFALAAFSLLRSDRCWTLRAGEAAHPVGPVWPVRLIQFQLTALYFVNAVAKTTTGYLSGGALAAMSQQLPNFRMDLTQGVFPLAGVAFPLWLAAAAGACPGKNRMR